MRLSRTSSRPPKPLATYRSRPGRWIAFARAGCSTVMVARRRHLFAGTESAFCTLRPKAAILLSARFGLEPNVRSRRNLPYKCFGRKPPISVGLAPGFPVRFRESEHGALTTEEGAFPPRCGAWRPLQNSSSSAAIRAPYSWMVTAAVTSSSNPPASYLSIQIFDGSDVACGVVNSATVTHSDLVAEVLELETRLCGIVDR